MSHGTVNPNFDTAGCIPVSANCVIWPGPDIPCISLCKGDSISKGIFSMATLLCNSATGILDITSLDLACLIDEGQQRPESLGELLELIISRICEEVAPQPPDPETPQEIELPACLIFESGGVPVTNLPVREYAALLANNICSIILENENTRDQIQSILIRLAELEGTELPENQEPQVIPSCDISGLPGTALPISAAFGNLEGYLCTLRSVLGTSTALSSAIAAQCAGLGSKPSLLNPSVTLSQLQGWKNSPSTVADALQNLWITVCDIRAKMENC
jgi:hypothetical protein